MQPYFVNAATESSSLFSAAEWIAFSALVAAIVGLGISVSDGRRARQEAKEREEKLRLNLLGALAQELKLNVRTFAGAYSKPKDILEGAKNVGFVPQVLGTQNLYSSNGAEIPKLGSEITLKLIQAYGKMKANEAVAIQQMKIYAQADGVGFEKIQNESSEAFQYSCGCAALACAEALAPMYHEVGEEIEPFVKDVLVWADVLAPG